MKVIETTNLSKAYQIGAIGTGTISRDIERFVITKILKKEDPFLMVGETNDRSIKGTSNIVWSLKDVSLSINEGDAVGIIGKNGAGKSTLLKLLSRVTSPTRGNIKVRGRIASLLEVGTGFHPELSGRENIFLNGAILGMRKKEIQAKFDEIVDFSGVERYIDTAVKRYSSGMYVRLAFAVAAHLEPEILIVDEVLAVGDAEFQKKCLGKMKDVSGKGRTVLFVSHNMAAIQSLCNSCILLKNGELVDQGSVQNIVRSYLTHYSDHSFYRNWELALAPQNDFARLNYIKITPETDDHVIRSWESFEIEFHYHINSKSIASLDVAFFLYDEMGVMVFDVSSEEIDEAIKGEGEGDYCWKCRIPKNLMIEGTYSIGRLMLVKNRGQVMLDVYDVIRFEIMSNKTRLGWMGQNGVVKPKLDWSIQKMQSA